MSAIYWLKTPPHDYLVVPLSDYPDLDRFADTSPVIDGKMHLNEQDTTCFLGGEGDLDPATFPVHFRERAPRPMVTIDMVSDPGHDFDISEFLATLYLAPWGNHQAGDA